ncbi:alpha-(1,6)-fucosyltransferase-like [Varroa jacobsoni]|uniref:GT23 domain-containing protein n=1 Tax=Varroa destructor TaxID=109461 RepID=A0A7M7KFJ4_VARDE|nr:alpha-(1,6)-fucosyltransferase-like [Varroa destructor]XP_022695975.1 alpha-(1,6)-fucosyltransferase-like [Varroa jacobsoni]
MVSGKKFCRRKLHTQRSVIVVIIAAVVTSIWLYARDVQLEQADGQGIDESFDQYVAHRKRDTAPVVHRGLLDIFGLKVRTPKTNAWQTLETLAKNNEFEDTLRSSAHFEPNGRFQFTNLEPLAGHIYQTLKDYQRFLTNSLLHLQLLVKRFPYIEERRLIEDRLISLASHSREYNRILRKELKDFMVRTGLARKSREALYKLKLKVQTAIQQRQAYPCSRTVKCKLTNPYGFASGIHDVLWCLIKGFQDNKRVVLDTKDWHYLNANFTWNESFRPLDESDSSKENCSNLADDPTMPGPNGQARLSIHTIPVDVAETLVRYHQEPYAWWFGQFIGYILRPSSLTEELVQQAKQLLGFKSPIVGLQIRRTDKFSEAAYHEVEEYMEHAEEYYRSLGANIPKRVFVATDEPQVLDDLRENFPDFVFISNVRSAELANDLDTRDYPASLQGLIIDLFLLAQTDKLVCTLSSGVCRIAYELMQARRTDATDQLVSLDVSYFYAYVAAPPVKAIYEHEPVDKRGLYLSPGYCVAKTSDTSIVQESVKKPNYNGFSVGILCGSNLLAGNYPTYKTLPTVRVNGTNTALF